jgi:hypothetical protein
MLNDKCRLHYRCNPLHNGGLVVAEHFNIFSKSTNTPQLCSSVLKKALVMPWWDNQKINYLQA